MNSVTPPMWQPMMLRLGVALVAGAVIGINRDLHGKPIGIRTLGLVSLGSCLLALAVQQYAVAHGEAGIDALSRAAQGIVSGIGFLGAGVILRTADQAHVRGLTTAATIWVCAAIGLACAIADWPLILMGVVGTLIVLIIGGPLEKAIHRSIDRDTPHRRSSDSTPDSRPPDQR